MDETWYMACDMQMFILSPLIIWPLWRWRRAGLAWVLFLIAALTGGIIAIYIVWETSSRNEFICSRLLRLI